jgi:RNA recognition motif-containing protein
MAIRIIVDQLPIQFTDADLRALFEPYGRVLSTVVLRPPLSGSLRFGYVEMESQKDAERAAAAINSRQIGVPSLYASVWMDAQS